MGRGGYNGGSTIIGPRSDWYSKPEPTKPKKKSANQGKAGAKTRKKKVSKAVSTTRMFEEDAARRAAGGTVSSSGRVVGRDDDAGLVVERNRGKTRCILFPVTGSGSSGSRGRSGS